VVGDVWPESVQQPLDVVAPVAQEMPAVKDLPGCRQRDVDRLGIGPGPVSGDDLDRWVRTHPRSHRSRFPTGEHFDRLTSLQVVFFIS